MRLAFWVNEALNVKTSQTTAMLIETAVERGHEVYVCGVEDLGLDGRGRVVASARPALGKTPGAELLSVGPPALLDLLTVDGVVIRTNPAQGTVEGGAWWDVAVPEVSPRPEVMQARLQYERARGGGG